MNSKKIFFELIKNKKNYRLGKIHTNRGSIDTPAFMPVGTQGTVKSIFSDDVLKTGTQIILGNTYHELLRPGIEILKKFGGLHNFMNWKKPILTDSGGIQEETSILGIPCITVRTTTERQITVKMKRNKITGYNYKKIFNAVSFFENKNLKPSKVFGKGNVAKDIFKNLKKIKNKEIKKQAVTKFATSFINKNKLNKFFHFI